MQLSSKIIIIEHQRTKKYCLIIQLLTRERKIKMVNTTMYSVYSKNKKHSTITTAKC